MPIYEYQCARCGVFTRLAKMSESAAPAACPRCDADAARVLSSPRLGLLSATDRVAHERNERSTHEPRRVNKNTHACGAGPCNHKPRARTGVRRPWMLGH